MKELNIKTTFAIGVMADNNRVENATRNFNNWLEPLISELNKENVIMFITFEEGTEQHFSFSKHMSNELFKKVETELAKYGYNITGLWSLGA